MSKWSISLIFSSLFSLTLLLSGCGSSVNTINNTDPTKNQTSIVQSEKSTTNIKENSKTELTVAAAADLVIAFKEIGDLYEKNTSIKLKQIFSSSGTAREQIENGAPYDVYASANIKFVDDLIEKDRIIADTKELYAIGRVGVAIKIGSTLQVKEVSDLLKPEFKKIAIANPEHAPYGLAAKQALESLGLWEKLKDKMVFGKDIQDTLTLIKSGNVEAGFISLSVVKKDEVTFLLIDDKLHKPLQQAIAVVKGTKSEKEARIFIKFVNGEYGREIMKKYGFVLPEEINE
ncbi:molybdenum ABC transporter, periplasmic molybdate-binding protein [Pseudobacteroides cellulosolvens ATCC 35603 = DSM 2933]|uniref:Molybdenum ABC transporter, periplasmic molybdate-binding protein n=1 Tax=Pseudobacteroides cellulosolvens ATCC 35603 = DSM 2933 TaxID=398512 RepID=A0A0L6JQC7_9FIRM|nr:molybdate ABC transporter substrate-binding protein [Pseudobacteroides cellulosolvens]KNY27567.1 molybdenum ABC transporter, periplasmic molybdate-binding protein [Pseudobacteroides cellulosolvens ATCC 35603 = DSM 2933]KNY30135.1 molybdenum ABC transporter, periplasmic molybdate-binding protein [Pseudobacteroides cellulosolvens ATCC 35603 = DSM 2933]